MASPLTAPEPRSVADLERALDQTGGVACMACRPRLLEAARALFARAARPTREDIEAVLDESMCLCTTYRPVLEAMLLTVRWRDEGVSG